MNQIESSELFEKWLKNGKFIHKGLTYEKGVNDNSALQIMIPDDRKMIGKICFISSYLTLTNNDLDSDIHDGFTIGKGKTMYWMMIWHSSGNVSVINKKATYKRWISGDTVITVHFKSVNF